jgi:hypothetical protein
MIEELNKIDHLDLDNDESYQNWVIETEAESEREREDRERFNWDWNYRGRFGI